MTMANHLYHPRIPDRSHPSPDARAAKRTAGLSRERRVGQLYLRGGRIYVNGRLFW